MEIEQKYKHENKESIIQKAKELGFKETKDKHQIDTYFLAGKKVNGTYRYLRVREDILKNQASLDYHILLTEFSTKEIESNIDNPKAVIEMFKELGYKIICIVNKKRKEFVKDNIKIVIDEVKDLGNFVEIEAEEESDEIIQKIKSLADNLNLKNKISHGGYPDLILKQEVKAE